MAIFYGKTVDEAISIALNELNLDKNDAVITVLEEPQKGFLGIGGKDAKVEVSKKEDDKDRVVNFLDGLFELINVPVSTEVIENGENKLSINLITTEPTTIIGYRGEVLDALQTLAGATANIGRDDYKKVVVNCENYREKREETLKNLAVRIADKAVKYGKKFSLEPMNPFERKIIHSALSEYEGVKTESQGEEPNRYIVVIPENLRNDKDTARYGKRDGKRNDKRDRRDNKKEKSEVIKLEKTGMSYGTFIGNSLKED